MWTTGRSNWRTAPVLEPPTDRPRPEVIGNRGDKRTVVYPKALADAVNELSHREGATLFMTLLAAYQTLLFRYTRQEDITIGSPVAGRGRSETENLIGFFINTVVLRGDLSGNPSFREVLRRVRQSALGVFAYQELPFDQLVSAVMPKRDTSRTPLFQVMFAIQNAPMPTLRLPNLTLTRLPAETGMSQFELTLNITRPRRGSLRAWSTTPTSSTRRWSTGCWSTSASCLKGSSPIRNSRSPHCRC